MHFITLTTIAANRGSMCTRCTRHVHMWCTCCPITQPPSPGPACPLIADGRASRASRAFTRGHRRRQSEGGERERERERERVGSVFVLPPRAHSITRSSTGGPRGRCNYCSFIGITVYRKLLCSYSCCKVQPHMSSRGTCSHYMGDSVTRPSHVLMCLIC